MMDLRPLGEGNEEAVMRIMRRIHVTAAAACAMFTTVAASGQGGPVHYRGLEQTPLGAATVSLDKNEHLIVANIGSSGDDGVRTELGAAGGWLAAVDIGPAGNLPTGMLFRLDAVALAAPEAGQDQKPVCMTLSETAGGQAALVVDTSFWNPPGLRVRALLGGVEVARFDHTPPFPSPVLVGPIGSGTAERARLVISNIGSTTKLGIGPGQELHYATLKLFGPTTVSFMAGSVDVLTDEIRISLTGLPAGSAMPPIEALEMRAANLTELVVSDEALGMFGSAHRGLGLATMTTTTGCQCMLADDLLRGDDGLCAEPDVDHVGAYGFRIEISPGAPDYSLLSTMRVRINELETKLQTIGLLGSAAGGTGIIVDFSDLGAATYTTEAFLTGVLIGTASGLTGPAAMNTDDPDCIIWDIQDGCSHAAPDWDLPVTMTVNGLGTLIADRLRITPELPVGPKGPVTFEAIEQVAMTGTNIATLAINGESITLIPQCPWDCANDDGEVGINDFLALLGQWNTPGSCDFDGGGVGINDFLALLANWGPCP